MEEVEPAQRDHVLRNPLQIIIKSDASPEQITEEVLTYLGRSGVIDYAPKGTLKLLNPAGRVLVALMERPDITMRELSVYLGTTEANVLKQVVALVEANLIARTKVKGRNTYRFNLDEVVKHPDITRFYTALQTHLHPPQQNDE